MGDKTSIEWTRGDDGTPGATWNPIVGCSKVSPGCDNCYAVGTVHRGLAEQHRGLTVRAEGATDWTGEVRVVESMMDRPLRWTKPRRIFVNSLSDLFHPGVSDETIARIFAVMALAPQHTFQVLTKRPQRMADMLSTMLFWKVVASHCADDQTASLSWPYRTAVANHQGLPNVWLGVSIESDRWTFRADHLRRTPAAVRWISAEPLLGPLPSLDLTGIDWLVVGGESGPKARPMHPQWVRDLRDRCQARFCRVCDGYGVVVPVGSSITAICGTCGGRTSTDPRRPSTAFYFKQWGAWVGQADYPGELTREVMNGCSTIMLDGTIETPGVLGRTAIYRLGKKAAGRTLDGRTWDEYPGGTS